MAFLGVLIGLDIGELHNMMFGLHLEKDKGTLRKFAKVREIERAFELKHKEFEHKV